MANFDRLDIKQTRIKWRHSASMQSTVYINDLYQNRLNPGNIKIIINLPVIWPPSPDSI